MNLLDTLTLFEPMTPHQRKLVLFKFENDFEFVDRSFELNFFGKSYRGHTRNLIDKQIYFLGSYEEGILNYIRDHLKRKKGTFIDIGANTGVHKLVASEFADVVHAFEPYDLVRDILKGHLETNSIGNVVVHSEGFSNSDGLRTFHLPLETNLGTGSFRGDFATGPLTQDLMLRKGSNLLRELNILRAEMIKIDVEGLELEVLEGLKEFISLCFPTLIFEYSHLNLEALKGPNIINDFLKQHYDFFVMRNPNFPTVDLHPWTPQEYGNVLAIPLSY